MLFAPLALLFPIAFLAIIGFAALDGAIPAWVAFGYGVSSLITGIAYASDKGSARRGDWRTPEETLHWLEMFGGWPGALIAQRLLRHKNHKGSFQFDYWCIVLAHLGLWAWLLAGRPGLPKSP